MSIIEPLQIDTTCDDATIADIEQRERPREAAIEIHSHGLLDGESIGKLGVVPLAVMLFYSVSGGPFGCEAAVRSGGNLYALLGFLLMPLVWSVPEAWITAELGTVRQSSRKGLLASAIRIFAHNLIHHVT